MQRPILVHVERIEIPRGRRKANPEGVKALANSIKEIGLQTPISVRCVQRTCKDGARETVYLLVAGLHRLEAVKKNGGTKLECVLVEGDETDAGLWEVAENLHRSDLTTQQRADEIARWVKLIEKKQSRVDPAGAGTTLQKSKRGRVGEGRRQSAITRIAEAAGLSHDTIRENMKIAGITPEAREAADAAGLLSHKSRLAIASVPSAKQVYRVAELANGQPSNRILHEWSRASKAERKAFANMLEEDLRALFDHP